jgi:tripartite-type tricarboxylate transporter receptor subunit TctC
MDWEDFMRFSSFSRMLLGSALAIVLAPGAASAQGDPAAGFPSKPIKVVVGFAAGGGNDIFARIVTQKLQERTGWTVVIENKPGAGGRLSAEYVAREAPDGYTLLVGASGAMAVGPIVFKTNYQTLKSFIPVTMIADFPLYLVINPEHPAKTVKELVEWSKKNPDKSNYATSSPAFSLPTELIKMKTGMQGTAISYRSSNESVLAVMGGNVTMTVVDPPPTTSQVQAGKLRALAVTAKQRAPELPDVPTLVEQGVQDVDVGLWSGFFAPAGTPKAIVDKLHKELREVIVNTDVKDKLAQMATKPSGMGPDDFAKHIDAEIKMWEGVVKAGNLKFSE